MTDEILVGGTYVRETQQDGDYELAGTDVTLRLGKDATIVAEYAQTTSATQGVFVSTDGGLSFNELTDADNAEGVAYGIRGDARLFNRLGVQGYYKWIDNDFSTSATTAQQGKELTGFGITYDVTDNTRITATHDIQELIDGGNMQTQAQVGATKTATTMLQMIHEARKLRLTAEYRHQEVVERDAQFETQTNTQEDTVAVRADYALNEKVELSVEQQMTLSGEKNNQTTLGIVAEPREGIVLKAAEVIGTNGIATKLGIETDINDQLVLTGDYGIAHNKDGSTENTATVGARAKVNELTELRTSLGRSDKSDGDGTTTVTFGGSSAVDEATRLDTEVSLSESASDRSTTLAFGGTSRVDETTQNETQVAVTDSTAEGESTSFAFGTRKRLTNDIELASTRIFETSDGTNTTTNKYGLARVKDNTRLEGSIARAISNSPDSISRSNIFGLSGDIGDTWALQGSYERGDIQNLDGTRTDRNVLSLGTGYVKKDEETGEQILKNSMKIEARFDEGDEDIQQFLVYNAIEGKLTPELTVFGKLEFSKTRNTTLGATEASHQEFVLGGAYRPIMHDRLNLLGRYTYLENQSPASQVDNADILEERAHVLSMEGIYDINEHWQVSEKFAYRIADEKVAGFDFTKTHTWLMIHRLNYKIDQDWMVGGEFRVLTQREAADQKRGFLIEGSRRLGEYAQLGIGYNFTDFKDDLTELDYTAQGPFVRLTGKFYDRTPEEIDRARQKWIDEKIFRWAWMMVQEELNRSDSPILEELNQYFLMAEEAYEKNDYEMSHRLYKDIIMAGQMMFQEASEYIRGRIHLEEQFQDVYKKANQYLKNGEYEKAKKILEKLLEEAQKGMIE